MNTADLALILCFVLTGMGVGVLINAYQDNPTNMACDELQTEVNNVQECLRYVPNCQLEPKDFGRYHEVKDEFEERCE